MNERALQTRTIWRVLPSGASKQVEDEELRECTLVLDVDGREVTAATLSPGDEALWALGHLFSRRMIASLDEVLSIEARDGRVCVRRKLARQGLPLRGRVVDRSSCPGAPWAWPDPLPTRWTVAAAAISAAVDELAEGPLFKRTGSAHVALLASREGRHLFRVEDVGRHNAMDKAIGWAVREGVDLADCFMALSGRLPTDMVHKALGAGIPLLASVSAASASGVEAAMEGGITLIGFVRRGRMNVYSVPERVAELAPLI